jgi:hypothetical protein
VNGQPITGENKSAPSIKSALWENRFLYFSNNLVASLILERNFYSQTNRIYFISINGVSFLFDLSLKICEIDFHT